MVPGHRINTGRNAEQLAFEHLRKHGLKPVARNFRTRRGELDLIMFDGGCLVFIEVRCRGERSFVNARFTVDRRKQRKLIAAASMYLAKHPQFHNHTCRFDVLAVDRRPGGEVSIDWLKDAFRLE